MCWYREYEGHWGGSYLFSMCIIRWCLTGFLVSRDLLQQDSEGSNPLLLPQLNLTRQASRSVMASAFFSTEKKRIVHITKHWVRSADLSRGPGLNMNDERRAGWSPLLGWRQVKISHTVPASCSAVKSNTAIGTSSESGNTLWWEIYVEIC